MFLGFPCFTITTLDNGTGPHLGQRSLISLLVRDMVEMIGETNFTVESFSALPALSPTGSWLIPLSLSL